MVKVIRQMEFNIEDDNSREYKIEAIQDSTVYAKELELRHLPGLYYLVF